MFKKLKPGKISIVVFLTALIWVWSDLSQDERLTLSDVRIEVATSTDPSLWVNFVVDGADPNLQTSLALDTVVLKGPASRVAEVNRRKNRGALDLNLFLVPQHEGLAQMEVHTLDVLVFLRQNDVIRKLGLTVESCEPPRLTVITQKLVEQFVTVDCVGIDSGLRANLDPSSVAAYIPEGKALQAKIVLTREEQNQARTGAIEKTPYVELVPGQQRPVPTKVKVALAPVQKVLTEDRVGVTYAICLGPNLQGKYRVVLENDQTELTGVVVRATALAHAAFRDSNPQLILFINDQDAQTPPDKWPIAREFTFRFPEEYVRKGEIEASGPAPVARFTLVPIPAPPETNLESDL